MFLSRPYSANTTTLLVCALSAFLFYPLSALSNECAQAKKIGLEQAKDPSRILGRMAVAGQPDLAHSGAEVSVIDLEFRTLNLKLPCLDLPPKQHTCCMDGFKEGRSLLQEEIENLIRKQEISKDPNFQICVEQYELGISTVENQGNSSDIFGGSCSEDAVAPNIDQIENPACYTMGYDSNVRLSEADRLLKDFRNSYRTSKPLSSPFSTPPGSAQPNASGAE